MSTPETINLFKILEDTKRIIKSHVHHFQILSLLFLLPLSLSLIIYPILQKTIFNSQLNSTLHRDQILFNLFYILFVTILFLCGTASISFSTYHAFSGTPIDLKTSVKSISKSFFPLLTTLAIQAVYWALISWSLVNQDIEIYSSKSSHNSDPYYMAFIILLNLLFLLVFLYLQVIWILVSVIVVVESKRGLEPMKRSAELVKGKTWVAFSMVLVFDLMIGEFFFVFAHGSWGLIFYMTIGLLYVTMYFLLSLVSNVVFYVYCIEMHGGVLPYSTSEEVPLLK